MRYFRVTPNAALEPYHGPRPFRAVVVIEAEVEPEWRSLVSKWLVDSGCLYMLAWGEDCSSWDDSVDLANLEDFDFGDIPDDKFVMTTWHEDETLSEVFEFAKSAAHSAAEHVQILETIVLHVSVVDRSAEYARLYATA